MLPLWVTIATIFYSLSMGVLLFMLGFGENIESPAVGWEILSPSFVLEAFFVALTEELIFRIIPLWILLKLSGLRTPTLVVLIATSIAFGLAHGGTFFLPMQGVAGLVFGLMFLKFSKSGKAILFAGTLAVGMHFAYDVSMGLIVALAGGSSF